MTTLEPDPQVVDAARTPRPGARRALLASGVALTWAIGLLPWALGARCPLAELAGVPCPGCGMTRAMRLLLAGDFAHSVRLHPLALPCALATAWLAIVSVVVTFRHGSPRAMIERTGFGPFAVGAYVAVATATLLLWLVRWVGLLGGPVPVGM